MDEVFKELFSYQGRFNRAKYWAYSIGIGATSQLISILVSMIVGERFSLIPLVLISLVTMYATICVLIKRSHDLDKSGLFVLLSFVPLVNLYPAILFMFIKGTDGSNQYGSDPISIS